MSAAPSLLEEENNITREESAFCHRQNEEMMDSPSPYYNPSTHKKVVHRWRTEWVPIDQPVALTPGYHLEDYNPHVYCSSAPLGDLEPLDAEVVRSLIASLNEVAEPIQEEEESKAYPAVPANSE
jgi:hypothetical protein